MRQAGRWPMKKKKKNLHLYVVDLLVYINYFFLTYIDISNYCMN